MVISSAFEEQRNYVQSLEAQSFKYGLAIGSAFVRGIREIGYKNSGTAIDELLDNSEQAGATKAHVLFGYEGKSTSKPSKIAVIDNGHGMIPEMIRLSMMWGGTHRENDRSGFGRFGYGLPSACVGQGRRFTVYSKFEGGETHSVTLDIDDIGEGKYTNGDGDIVVPTAQKAELPKFVQRYMKEHFPEWKSGTVVIIDRLDKLTWKTSGTFQNKLLEHVGVTYHQLRADFEIAVNGIVVEPIDPLFLTPGYKWYDFDADRAEGLEPIEILVRDKKTKETQGVMRVRFAYMGPSFGSIDKTRAAVGKNANPRFNILKEYNGIIFTRMGRVIDVVTRCPLTTFVNNDRYFKIEIDFPASLDEYFNIPTSKQRVDVSDRIWDILKEHGFLKAIDQLRKKVREAKATSSTERENDAKQKRPSEQAMEQVAQLAPVPDPKVEQKRKERGQERLVKEAEKRAAETGKSVQDAQKEIEGELTDSLYKVARISVPGAPFFQVEQIGGTKVLQLNTSTRFFQEVYAGPNSNPAVRSALEIMLFSIGDRMLDGSERVQEFYAHEIPEWSRKLQYALSELSTDVSIADMDDDDQDDIAA